MITTLLFDFNGIVVTDGTQRLQNILSRKYNAEQINDLLYGDVGNDYRKGLIDDKIFWSKIKSQLQTKKTEQELKEEWYQGFIPIAANIQIIKNIVNTRKYFMTNSSIDLVEYIKQIYGNLYKSLFDGGVYSFEYANLGLTKMDAQLYELIMKRWNILPKETVFIDHDKKKLQIPATLGIKTILYTNSDNLRKQIVKLGITMENNNSKQSHF